MDTAKARHTQTRYDENGQIVTLEVEVEVLPADQVPAPMPPPEAQ